MHQALRTTALIALLAAAVSLAGLPAPGPALAQGSGPCAGTATADAAEGGSLDITTYAGSWRCADDVLVFTFVTDQGWGDDQLSEVFVRIDTDGDITNGCSEADYLVYGNNPPGDDHSTIVAGVFRSPSCDDLQSVGAVAVRRPAPSLLVLEVPRALVGGAEVLGHYGSLASPGEDRATADYAPDRGRVVLDLSPIRDPESVGMCVTDPLGDVEARDADGTSTPVDAPPFDLSQVCTYWGRDLRVDAHLPAMDFAAAGAGARLSVLFNLEGDNAAERILRATWDGVQFVVELVDLDNQVVCRGRARAEAGVLRVGGMSGDCLGAGTEVGVSPGMGRRVGDVTTFDRAGPGAYTPIRRAAPNDPTFRGADPRTIDVPEPADRPAADGLRRLAGPARVETSVTISADTWPSGAAAAVVARQDVEADALTGAALAAAIDGPLLLTTSSQLPDVVATELRRLLPQGARVYALGGTAALGDQVLADIQQLGFGAVRLSGPTRIETGVAVAEEAATFLDEVRHVLIADGFAFQWPLIAGAAAGANSGVVLTTARSGLSPQAQAFLDDHPEATRTAVGPVAAQAAPDAEPLDAGGDPYATSALVAERFFPDPTRAVVASGESFPDGLAGGALAGALDAPLLLSPRASLTAEVADHLEAGTWQEILLLGGEAALSEHVEQALSRFVD